jgi:hypothetical protein
MRENINSDTELYCCTKRLKKKHSRIKIQKKVINLKRIKKIKKKQPSTKKQYLNENVTNALNLSESKFLKNISLKNNESLILLSLDHELEIKSRSDNLSLILNRSSKNIEVSNLETESINSIGKQNSIISFFNQFGKLDFNN